MKQRKKTLFDKLLPIFVTTTMFLKNRTSNDLNVETMRYSKRNWEKGMKFIEFTTKESKCPNFFIFDDIVPFLDPFRKIILIRNTIGSGLKRVATGSVSKRY